MFAAYVRDPAIQKMALVVGIAAFVIVAFGQSYSSMWDLWQTSDHQHGLLVFPISLFLIWRVRHQLSVMPVAPDAFGLLIVLPLAVLWLAARLAGIQVVEHIAVLALIPAAVTVIAGRKVTKSILFPLIFLILAVPVGEALVPHLMVITADISAGLLKLSGIPLLRNGQFMSLPGGEFVVADVCSGLRYLLTGIMVSLLFGYLTFTRFRKRLIMVFVTAIALVIANGVRAYIVMAIASASQMKYFAGRDHIYFGWLLFGVVMMLIMWIAARYADEEREVSVDLSDTMAIRASHTVLPLIAALGLVMLAVTLKPLQADFGEAGAMLAAAFALIVFVFFLLRGSGKKLREAARASSKMSFHFRGGSALTIFGAILVLGMVSWFAVSVEKGASSAVFDVDIQSASPCNVVGPWRRTWTPQFGTPEQERSATLGCGDGAVGIFIAAYGSALQGTELISSTHYVVPQDWDRVSARESRIIKDSNGHPETIAEIRVGASENQDVIWYWYEVDGRVSSTSFATKFNQTLALSMGRPAGGRVVVIETDTEFGLTAARQRLQGVAAAFMRVGENVEQQAQE